MLADHGVSLRPVCHRQSLLAAITAHTFAPVAPARCATAESIVTSRSRFASRPAVSLKSVSSWPKSSTGNVTSAICSRP